MLRTMALNLFGAWCVHHIPDFDTLAHGTYTMRYGDVYQSVIVNCKTSTHVFNFDVPKRREEITLAHTTASRRYHA